LPKLLLLFHFPNLIIFSNMNILIIVCAICILLFLMLGLRLNAFLALIITALGTGIALGMSIEKVIKSMETGVGSTLGQLALVIGFGAMLGDILAESGAVQRIAERLIAFFGEKYIRWAILLSSLVVGIPMFFNSAFVVVIPIVYALAKSTRLPLVYLGMPMVAALSVTHGYLPPHPAPSAICNIYKANATLVLLYGLMVGIPAVIAGGIFTGKWIKNIQTEIPPITQLKTLTATQLPPLNISLLVALSPILWMAIGTLLKVSTVQNSVFYQVGSLVGDPSVSLLISVLSGVYFLGIRQGKTMDFLMNNMTNAVKAIAMILLIIGGGGAFKQVLVDSGVGKQIADAMLTLPVSPLILAWLITAALRTALGSATVAALTAAGLVAPLADSVGVNRELLTLATGAGSIFFSNVNDTGFWMFKEYFNTTIGQTFRSWSVMEAVVSLVGLGGVLLMSLFF
jgi:gluconate transporter